MSKLSDDIRQHGKFRKDPLLLDWADEVQRLENKLGLVDSPDVSKSGQARSEDPVTAKRAARNNPGRRGTQRGAVFKAIAESMPNGIIAEDASQITLIPFRSVTPRIGELKADGFVQEKGNVTRPGKFGARQAVLVLTDKGIAWSKNDSH